jgi:3-methyladenine DNA glycosylase AlkD
MIGRKLKEKMLNELLKELEQARNPEQAANLQRFFKTGKGEYGEGDIFLGIMVPEQRKIAKKFKDLNLSNIQTLLESGIHEKRLIALFILIDKYKKADKEKNEIEKGNIFNFYLKNSKNINNWDLVDLSAPNIIGNFLQGKSKKVLYELAKSKNLWERRIAVLASFSFIKKEEFEDAIAISESLLDDKEDLIHKAVGWMLREIGKRNKEELLYFLGKHYKVMPRTMLRYSIEKLEESEREKWMKK